MSVSRTVSEIFSVNEWLDLEIGGRGRSKSLKLAPFNRSHTSSCSSTMVTMAVSYIVIEINRDIGRKMPIFFLPPILFNL